MGIEAREFFVQSAYCSPRLAFFGAGGLVMGCQVGRDTIQLTRMRKHLKPTIFNLQKLSGLAAPSSAVKSNMQTAIKFGIVQILHFLRQKFGV